MDSKNCRHIRFTSPLGCKQLNGLQPGCLKLPRKQTASGTGKSQSEGFRKHNLLLYL